MLELNKFRLKCAKSILSNYQLTKNVYGSFCHRRLAVVNVLYSSNQSSPLKSVNDFDPLGWGEEFADSCVLLRSLFEPSTNSSEKAQKKVGRTTFILFYFIFPLYSRSSSRFISSLFFASRFSYCFLPRASPTSSLMWGP